LNPSYQVTALKKVVCAVSDPIFGIEVHLKTLSCLSCSLPTSELRQLRIFGVTQSNKFSVNQVGNSPHTTLFFHLSNVAIWLQTTKLPRRSNSKPSRARQAAGHNQRRESAGVQRERERQAIRVLLIEERREEERRRLIEERTREAQRIYQELKKSASQQQLHRAENQIEEQEEFILQLAIEPSEDYGNIN
jgi:hypothetical protein